MRHISIRERFHPFSHTPGVVVLLPGTSLCLLVHPTTVSCFDLEGTEQKTFPLPIEGPVSNFTVVQDLEQGAVLIFGKDQKGFFRFRCTREGVFQQEKGGTFSQTLFKPTLFFPVPTPSERLLHTSLQKRSVERLVEKGDALQLLQPLYRLLQWYEPLNLEMPLDVEDYILGGFEGLFAPTGLDMKKRGFSFSFPPFTFLRALRSKVTSLFFSEEGDKITLCPHLPKKMSAGRIKGVKVGDCLLDMEWRKGQPRRVQVTALKEKALYLAAKGLTTVRVGGKQVPLDRPIHLTPGQSLFFDRFQQT